MFSKDNEQLKFPLTWHGSLIAYKTAGDMSFLIQDVFNELKLTETTLASGNASSEGRYTTWKVSAVLPDHTTMLALFTRLEQLPGARMLI